MLPDSYPKVYLYRRIVQAKMFIDRHYAEEIDLNNISDEACFSKFHFIRLFTSIYGKTPHQYLQSVRVDKAKELLKGGKTVSDACFLPKGIPTGKYFTVKKNGDVENQKPSWASRVASWESYSISMVK